MSYSIGWNIGCGVKKPESKIVGGQTAEVHEYPWMAVVIAISKMRHDL